MQKKLIALAVAAAFSAPVLAADVTVYGIVDGGVANFSGDGQKGEMRAVSGGLSPSRVGFSGSEALDNGMKASINLEYGLNTANSDTLSMTRQEMVSLEGGFGKISTGVLHTGAFFFNVKYDPIYGSLASPLQSINAGAGSMLGGNARMTQAIAYDTPKMGPLSARVDYSTGLANGTNAAAASAATTGLKTTVMMLSGTYAEGPLSVSAIYGKNNSDNAAFSSQTDTILGASYNLGVAKLLGTYSSSKTTVTNSLFSLSVVAPMGSGSVMASYAANSRNAASTNGKGFMVGYQQNMSKTITGYVMLENVQNDSGTSAHSVATNSVTTNLTAGGSSSLLVAGLRKKF